ncbi:jg11262 [Pararge aegeria aegeria]|uniref:Dynein regulatory complex protein 10 n=1 Tax=Pararge aegeria aegeria TaxID=348720 RepID=A0A8S4RKS3_9NEOP|nr:jg11262 [Pararge aegeria aegeria]
MDTQSSGTLQSPSTYSGSSKTGSSKSGGTERGEEDLTKDNAASPIDLECHIQAERITKILDEAVYKTKLALCLSNLVQEYRTLSSILTTQHMDDLIFIFEQYDNPLFSTSLLNMAAMDDIKGTKVAPGLEYLLVLEQFRDLMVRQMDTTAAEELTAKINTRKLEGSNEKLREKIREYTENLKTESKRFEETMAMKADIISKLEKELALLNYEADVKLKKKILDSDRQMVLATRAHIVKNEVLLEEEVESREMYENLLRVHLIDEKNQRARRFKVETQLLSWLQKYDLEMGDKQVELDEFTEKYEDEIEKCENLEIKLAEQDKEYIPLMAEREEEYHQEMTEKLNKFKVEHAARVIQMAWRDVLANRAEKKKLKKLQKKMQAAQAAAEKKAAKK